MKRMTAVFMMVCLLLSAMAGCKRPDTESANPASPIIDQAGSGEMQQEQPPIQTPSGSEQTGENPQQLGEKQPSTQEDPLSSTPTAVVDLTADIAYTEEWPMLAPDANFIPGQMDFSVELFRRTAEKERCKNTLISPLSVTMALAMAANGAEGKTAEEMLEVLGGHTVDELNAYLANWRVALQNADKAELHLANSIWIRDAHGFEAKTPFLAANAKYYGSQVFKAPFNEIGKQKINEWVSQKTDKMIPQLLEEIRPETMMFLINALAFDAQWREPYQDRQVQQGVFYSLEGKEQTAEMLCSTEETYLEGEGVIGFCRPYVDKRFAFGALLPDEDSFEEYVGSFSGEKLLKLLENRQAIGVDVQLPKFSTEYEVTLNEILKEMGMPSAFGGGFGKMSNEDLYISEVLHKTVIEVHEAGTRAAAVTSVAMDKSTAVLGKEEPKVVKLDRPFIYFILDQQTKLPIFIGTLTSL